MYALHCRYLCFCSTDCHDLHQKRRKNLLQETTKFLSRHPQWRWFANVTAANNQPDTLGEFTWCNCHTNASSTSSAWWPTTTSHCSSSTSTGHISSTRWSASASWVGDRGLHRLDMLHGRLILCLCFKLRFLLRRCKVFVHTLHKQLDVTLLCWRRLQGRHRGRRWLLRRLLGTLRHSATHVLLTDQVSTHELQRSFIIFSVKHNSATDTSADLLTNEQLRLNGNAKSLTLSFP